MSETRPSGLIVASGKGERVRSPLGGDITFILRGDQTGGKLAVMDVVNGPGEGPPLHMHAREDETMYVIEGEFRWRLGEEITSAGAGSFVYIPRGLPHTWQITGDSPGRMIVTFAPAGMEGFFDELSSMDEFDLDAFRAAAGRHAMEVVGPPLAESHPMS